MTVFIPGLWRLDRSFRFNRYLISTCLNLLLKTLNDFPVMQKLRRWPVISREQFGITRRVSSQQVINLWQCQTTELGHKTGCIMGESKVMLKEINNNIRFKLFPVQINTQLLENFLPSCRASAGFTRMDRVIDQFKG